MRRPNRYGLTLRHDEGVFRIITWASSKAQAIQIVMADQRCPRCAIRKVKRFKYPGKF